jgi:hypothetical protein
MKVPSVPRIRFLALSLTATLGLVIPASRGAAGDPPAPQTPSSDSFPNKSITIYVADFDLDAVHSSRASGGPTSRATTPATAPQTGETSGGAAIGSTANSSAASNATSNATSNPTSNAGSNANSAASSATGGDTQKADGQKSENVRIDTQTSDAQKTDALRTDPAVPDSPRVQAAKLVDLTSTTLVKVLEQQGYVVKRLRGAGARPDSGVIIRGVFAQLDENSALRREVIGGAVTDPRVFLFVGIGNLAKPDQTLYMVVAPAPADNVGPAISLSVYAPIGRYELERDPSEELLKKTATNIAADLTRLLNANPLAVEN